MARTGTGGSLDGAHGAGRYKAGQQALARNINAR